MFILLSNVYLINIWNKKGNVDTSIYVSGMETRQKFHTP